MGLSFGQGSAWVRRRFAKPLDTGSIPALASKLQTRMDCPRLAHYWPRQWRYWLGLRVAWWAIHRGEGYKTFAAGLVYPIALAGYARAHDSPSAKEARKAQGELASAIADRDRFKGQAIAARKQLSKARRNDGQR